MRTKNSRFKRKISPASSHLESMTIHSATKIMKDISGGLTGPFSMGDYQGIYRNNSCLAFSSAYIRASQ